MVTPSYPGPRDGSESQPSRGRDQTEIIPLQPKQHPGTRNAPRAPYGHVPGRSRAQETASWMLAVLLAILTVLTAVGGTWLLHKLGVF